MAKKNKNPKIEIIQYIRKKPYIKLVNFVRIKFNNPYIKNITF